MIAAIRGILERKGADHVVVGIGGVSLQVYVPITTLNALPAVGKKVVLHTHLLVREDEASLYGFAADGGRHLFEMLISVSGVGPRAALSVLSAMEPEQAALAIASGNADSLSQAPGVGKKTAQRLILELRSKIERDWSSTIPATFSEDQGDAVKALLALGYSPVEAREALAGEDMPELPLTERVRRALRRVGGI